jgi:hypothetical protein
VIAAVLGGAAYGALTVYRHITTALISPGCQAGSTEAGYSLDTDQAPVAATIAGVAARMGLPAQALEIALATALQESKLTNLPYGDRDSVGVFQQRPSEGWGTAAELQDPEFASTAFFKALVKVPNYLKIPQYQAAQDVQHSADGSAYAQWQSTAQQLTTSYTARAHDLTCWYTPPASPKPEISSVQARLPQVFGPASTSEGSVMTSASASASTTAGLKVGVRPAAGWTVANWLMTHASMYQLTKVSYDGWQWSASLTETSWQHVTGGDAGSILAS